MAVCICSRFRSEHSTCRHRCAHEQLLFRGLLITVGQRELRLVCTAGSRDPLHQRSQAVHQVRGVSSAAKCAADQLQVSEHACSRFHFAALVSMQKYIRSCGVRRHALCLPIAPPCSRPGFKAVDEARLALAAGCSPCRFPASPVDALDLLHKPWQRGHVTRIQAADV
jgi:hypothetical protein